MQVETQDETQDETQGETQDETQDKMTQETAERLFKNLSVFLDGRIGTILLQAYHLHRATLATDGTIPDLPEWLERQAEVFYTRASAALKIDKSFHIGKQNCKEWLDLDGFEGIKFTKAVEMRLGTLNIRSTIQKGLKNAIKVFKWKIVD